MKTNKLIANLNALLANYQIFYQNLRGFHWNVTGISFFGLHEKFEELYLEAAETIDEIAERILAIGGKPLHTFEEYIKTATLHSAANVAKGEETVALVLENSKTLLNQLNTLLQLAADQKDEGTVTVISELISVTEKRIWMLNAFLG